MKSLSFESYIISHAAFYYVLIIFLRFKMSSLTQFTLWTNLPSELKNEVIRRIDPKTVLKFAQASKDSLKRVDFLLETKQVRKIVVNTLCVKSGNTDQVYLECVQHDKEHAHEELKMMTCLCCIGSCVHYQNEFEQHCRRVKLGNCKTKFVCWLLSNVLKGYHHRVGRPT